MARRSRVQPSSLDGVKKGLRKRLGEASKAARNWWFYDLGLDQIFTDALARAPIRYGKLRASGWAAINGSVVVARGSADATPKRLGSPLGKSNREAVLTLGFGGPLGGGLPYARWVHEITWRKHKVGEAKFLSNAVAARLQTVLPELGQVVDQALKGAAR